MRQNQTGVPLVGVPGRDDIEAMQAFVDRHGLGDMMQIVDLDGSLWERFQIPGQPAWALIGADGTLLDRRFGGMTGEELDAWMRSATTQS